MFKKIKAYFKRKTLYKLTNDNLLERISEFLKRVKAPMPDFITIGAGLLGFKKWLAEPFLVKDYKPFVEVLDREEREALSTVRKILTEVNNYEGEDNE